VKESPSSKFAAGPGPCLRHHHLHLHLGVDD
jgi:hypothetical protein